MVIRFIHATQSGTNTWEKIDVIDAEDGSSINGDTGITYNASESHRQFYVDDARSYNWIGVIFEEFASGDFTVKLDSQ